jgi:hypothetical protein
MMQRRTFCAYSCAGVSTASTHCLIFLKSHLNLVKLAEASALPFEIVPGLRGFPTSGDIRRSGLTFHKALVGVGGVDSVDLLLEDE